jgi:hypothetical protein
MLNFKRLTCRAVATRASDYLDKHVDGQLTVNIRIHLLLCTNCRRFVKHLRLTKDVVPQFLIGNADDVDAEAILKRIKATR